MTLSSVLAFATTVAAAAAVLTALLQLGPSTSSPWQAAREPPVQPTAGGRLVDGTALLTDVLVRPDRTWSVAVPPGVNRPPPLVVYAAAGGLGARPEITQRTPVLVANIRCETPESTVLDVVAAYETLRAHHMLFPEHVQLVYADDGLCADASSVPPIASAARQLLAAAFPRGAIPLARLAPGRYTSVVVGLTPLPGLAAGPRSVRPPGPAATALRHQLGAAGASLGGTYLLVDDDSPSRSAWSDLLRALKQPSKVVRSPTDLVDASLVVAVGPNAASELALGLPWIPPGALVAVVHDARRKPPSPPPSLAFLASYFGVRLAWLPPTESTARSALRRLLQANDDARYLLYAPWEQLGNQRLALASACAVAALLNRILVVPPFGYRAQSPDAAAADAWGYHLFDPNEFTWVPAQAVWDPEALEALPCDWIDHGTFAALGAAASGDAPLTVRYHELSGGTTLAQVLAYYRDVAGIAIGHVEYDRPDGEYELTAEEIQRLHGHRRDRVLALGVLFRYYDFGCPASTVRPRRHYAELVTESAQYAAIARALQPAGPVRAIAGRYRAHLLDRAGATQLACVHLRRRDYRAKCKYFASDDAAMQRQCLTPVDAVLDQVAAALNADAARRTVAVYIASDAPDPGELGRLADRMDGWTADAEVHARAAWPVGDEGPTPLDLALLDQQLCTDADLFWGNAFSSFSTAIFNQRALAGRPSSVL